MPISRWQILKNPQKFYQLSLNHILIPLLVSGSPSPCRQININLCELEHYLKNTCENLLRNGKSTEKFHYCWWCQSKDRLFCNHRMEMREDQRKKKTKKTRKTNKCGSTVQKCIHCGSTWNEFQVLGQEKANEFLKIKINSQTTVLL